MTDISVQLHRPDQVGLRRFSLAIGLLLMSYSIAGISLESDSAVSLFGIPFRLARPQMLPYVLAVATLYGLLRFYYYCVLVMRTPYSVRRQLLNRLIHHIRLEDGLACVQLRSFGVYLGPTKFELGPQRPWMYRRDRLSGESESGQEHPAAWTISVDVNGIPIMPEEGVQFQKDLNVLFPAFAHAQVVTRWNYQSAEATKQVRLHVVIPNRCRLAAIFEDLDYLAPIWLNVFAIAVFVWSRWP